MSLKKRTDIACHQGPLGAGFGTLYAPQGGARWHCQTNRVAYKHCVVLSFVTGIPSNE